MAVPALDAKMMPTATGQRVCELSSVQYIPLPAARPSKAYGRHMPASQYISIQVTKFHMLCQAPQDDISFKNIRLIGFGLRLARVCAQKEVRSLHQ